ncbi:hypothetical protein B0H66DRAFT_590528 [Apodospora peruviana]|uniref:Uncharacterized protein n=1 Tax=Apodospora peruviana TaxID=516989 RepID=A0AAE0M8X9_9PEZI|nr:hypothetical protein B0H66DRAFT_590528 [Apodospora peruviana]
MQLPTLKIAAFLAAALSSMATATVYTGTIMTSSGNGYYYGVWNYAWVNGVKLDTICPPNIQHDHIISSPNENPCGRNFCAAPGNCGYELRGCGGDLQLYKDGKFNSNCHYEKKKVGCPHQPEVYIQQNWACY